MKIYIGMDADGQIYGYQKKPYWKDGKWRGFVVNAMDLDEFGRSDRERLQAHKLVTAAAEVKMLFTYPIREED